MKAHFDRAFLGIAFADVLPEPIDEEPGVRRSYRSRNAVPTCMAFSGLQSSMSDTFLPHLLSDVATAIVKATERRLGYMASEARVLMAMGETEDATPTAIARAANLSKVDVSRAVARLISARLVSSKTCPADGRAKLLRLTRKGTLALASITEKSTQVQHELLTVLAPHEATGLVAALEKLQATVASGEAVTF